MNATAVTAGPAESNGRLLLGIWRDSLHVTCGMTACAPGSAPGPTLGNEYGKTLPLPYDHRLTNNAYLSAITATVTNISQRVLPTRWRQKSIGIDMERLLRHCHPMHSATQRDSRQKQRENQYVIHVIFRWRTTRRTDIGQRQLTATHSLMHL